MCDSFRVYVNIIILHRSVRYNARLRSHFERGAVSIVTPKLKVSWIMFGYRSGQFCRKCPLVVSIKPKLVGRAFELLVNRLFAIT